MYRGVGRIARIIALVPGSFVCGNFGIYLPPLRGRGYRRSISRRPSIAAEALIARVSRRRLAINARFLQQSFLTSEKHKIIEKKDTYKIAENYSEIYISAVKLMDIISFVSGEYHSM